MTPDEFRELRISAGLSMREAARIFDTPYSTWCSWEKGDRRVPGLAIMALSLYKAVNSRRKANKYTMIDVMDGEAFCGFLLLEPGRGFAYVAEKDLRFFETEDEALNFNDKKEG